MSGVAVRPKPIARATAAEDFGVLRETLRAGSLVADLTFDELYPAWVRRLSPVQWTPVQAAIRAAQLLAAIPGVRILDVGSGVGKFCMIAAASAGARVSGVEHRGHLVDIAEDAAARLGVNVTFTRGTLAACDPYDFDGLYLFNPFAENVCSNEDRIDTTVELSAQRLIDDIAAAEDFLRAARAGTRVVTYCGFGGELPHDYIRLVRERCAGVLELWVKISGSSDERGGMDER